MTISIGRKLTRKIGPERNEVCWDLKNLAFNFPHYLQRCSHIATVA
jgi:hypothetical protein